MPQDLENVIVERISLVTNDSIPAVEKAETRFALFKAMPKWCCSKVKMSLLSKVEMLL